MLSKLEDSTSKLLRPRNQTDKPHKKRKIKPTDEETVNRKKLYEANRSERSFDNDWLKGGPWLKFDEEKNMMKCDLCCQFFRNNSTN